MPSLLNWASWPIALPVLANAPLSRHIRSPRITGFEGEAELVDDQTRTRVTVR